MQFSHAHAKLEATDRAAFWSIRVVRRADKCSTSWTAAQSADASLLAQAERKILADHAALGCEALVGVEGQTAFPFVLQRRAVRRVIPCGQLIYCRAMDEFFQFSPLIGRLLLPRSGPLLLIDAGAPAPGLIGRYFPERNPKYFKGAHPPRLGDLAYTELPVFGP